MKKVFEANLSFTPFRQILSVNFLVNKLKICKFCYVKLHVIFPKPEYRHIPIQLPFRGIPTGEQLNKLHDFFRSDHTPFWLHNLTAIWLTDTANFRGFMVDCYHQACDNMNHVTQENLGFLSKTADVVTAMTEDFTTSRGK